MYSCLPKIINPIYIHQLREMVPSPRQNTVGVCNQIILLHLHCISSRLVTLLEVMDASVQVSDIFYHTVRFKLINFGFQIFLLFVPEMSTSFTSYVFYIIYVLSMLLLFASCNHCPSEENIF